MHDTIEHAAARAAAHAARDRALRILWIKVGGLWPPTAGGRLRTFHTLKGLSERHAVTLLTTHGPGDDLPGLRRALPRCEVVSLPHAAPKQGTRGFALALVRSWLGPQPVDLARWKVPALRALARGRLAAGDVDLVVTDFLVTAPSVPPTGRVPNVLFEHNVEHVIWSRLAAAERRPWRRRLLSFEARKMKAVEADACRRASSVLAVSEVDRAGLSRIAPEAHVDAIPTGVDVDYFRPDESSTPQGLVFTGAMDWYPNEDGILWFLADVLPRIRASHPGTPFRIVGRNPSARLRAAAEATGGVTVTGTVADVRPDMNAAAVYVVPLRTGGGTRLKVLEALAMGKAVVSTTVGAEGLPLRPDEHLVLADGAESFARAVSSLLGDDTRRRSLGEAGRRLVVARYGWSEAVREFERRLREVVACA